MSFFHRIKDNLKADNYQLVSAIRNNVYLYDEKSGGYQFYDRSSGVYPNYSTCHSFPQIYRLGNPNTLYYFRMLKHPNVYDHEVASKLILNPVAGFIWPIDIIKLPYDQGYAYVYARDIRSGCYKTLTDYIEIENLQPSEERLQRAKEICVKTLQAAQAIYEKGLAYYGWYADNVILASDGKIQFLFEEGIAPFYPSMAYNKSYENWYYYCSPFQEVYDDKNYDHFDLVVLLFYTLIGMFPYDGRLGLNYMKGTEAYRRWYRAEAAHNGFIFANKTENVLPPISASKKFEKRWDALPENLKTLFRQVFNNEPVVRNGESIVRSDQLVAYLSELFLKWG